MKIQGLVLKTIVMSVVLSSTYASRPNVERSLESCEESLRFVAGQHYRGFSSSLLIPAGRLIAMRQLEYLANLHALGDSFAKEHPTPGLAQMFLTASSAADALIAHLDGVVDRPEYKPGDIVQGAVETLALMLGKQPKYIRDAVLIRDGVVMVVPLLERIEKSKNQNPLYRPVIVKGHQELEDSDVLAAAFAAWALGGTSNLGRLPETAKIYLKPIAAKRNIKISESTAQYESFEIHVRDHLPEVERLHERYVYLLSNPEELHALPLRRNSAATKSSWFPYMRKLMEQEGNLTMMPYPPNEEELKVLAENGIRKVSELAKVSVRGQEFFSLSVRTGIRPEKLQYYIAHALAIEAGKPLKLTGYDDPFAGVDWLLHIDFEDVMERDVRSGVYLFGAEIEDTRSRKRNRILEKKFIFSPRTYDPRKIVDQNTVDTAWANFFRYILEHFPDPETDNFKITVYSHHEITKFNQQFDIVEGKKEDFSPRERRSIFYQSFQRSDGAEMGRYIRNRSFFRSHPDISPNLIFTLLDKIVDLLPYIRWNFAFPTHTNSLKYVLDYIMPSTGQVLRYPEGWNGLESIEWAKNAYQTGEENLFERIRIYNEFDIDSNYFIADFIRQQAGRAPDSRLQANFDLEFLNDVGRAADSVRVLRDVAQKSELFREILGRPLSSLGSALRAELGNIFSRDAYLADRRNIRESETHSKSEKDQLLQRTKYEFSNHQKHQLIQFFERVGKFDRNRADYARLDKIADLFLNYRLHEFTQRSLNRMIAYERLERATSNLRIIRRGGGREHLRLPENWIAKLDTMIKEGKFKDLHYVLEEDLRSLIQGIYFQRSVLSPNRPSAIKGK